MSRDEQARDNDVMIGEFIARWDDAADGVMMDADTAQALAREFKRMRELIYIPGVFQCAKCSFRLVQSNLNAHDGTVTSRDAPGEKCPNDGSPMWRVTYRDDVSYSYDRWEEQVNRAVAAEKALEALRGASGGGTDATAMERLRIMSKQKLASEMEDHEIDCADWRGGYEHMVSEARAVFASIAPDHPAENAKSSGEVRAASVAELLEMLSVANQDDGSAIFDHTPDEIGLHVMENHKEILAALETIGKERR